MGVRILLGITLVSLLVVLGSSVYAEGQSWDPSAGPRWDLTGRTTQGQRIRFRLDGGGQIYALSVSVQAECDWGDRPFREWDADNGSARFAWRGGRVRVVDDDTTSEADGWTLRAPYVLSARAEGRSVTGTLTVEETWTHTTGRVFRCHARHVGFNARRD